LIKISLRSDYTLVNIFVMKYLTVDGETKWGGVTVPLHIAGGTLVVTGIFAAHLLED